MGRYMTQLKNAKRDEDVRKVCTAMLAHFGGLRGFAVAWVDYYEESRRKGSPAAFRCLQTIVQLIQSSSDN